MMDDLASLGHDRKGVLFFLPRESPGSPDELLAGGQANRWVFWDFRCQWFRVVVAVWSRKLGGPICCDLRTRANLIVPRAHQRAKSSAVQGEGEGF
jgi:hypothetical protein